MSDRTKEYYPGGEQNQEALLSVMAEIKNEHLLDALQRVLKTGEGKTVVWAILEEASIYSLSFVPEEPHATSFREGRRSVGLALLSQIMTADPASYSDMQEDARLREEHFRHQAEGRTKDLFTDIE